MEWVASLNNLKLIVYESFHVVNIAVVNKCSSRIKVGSYLLTLFVHVLKSLKLAGIGIKVEN